MINLISNAHYANYRVKGMFYDKCSDLTLINQLESGSNRETRFSRHLGSPLKAKSWSGEAGVQMTLQVDTE